MKSFFCFASCCYPVCHSAVFSRSGTVKEPDTALNLWFSTLVPTLLPFMVFSNILIQSRLIEHLLFLPGRFTRKYLRSLLRPGCMRSCAAFSSAILPVPKSLSDLLKTDQIESEGGLHGFFGFCNNVSPAFLITYFLTLHLSTPGESRDHLTSFPATWYPGGIVCLMAFCFLRQKHIFSP